MKKILVLVLLIISSFSVAFAEPIVELAAPRFINPNFMPVDEIDTRPTTQKTKAGAKKTTKTKALSKRKTHKKAVAVKPDYKKLSKMIEYGYYDYADEKLNSALARNSKDIKADALLAISFAKQGKLDAAQKKIDCLLKTYPNNSDLHYAQGVVNYQRTNSSNMVYRNNSKKLMDDSLTEFKKSIALDKTNAKAYNAAGVISIINEDMKGAKQYFTQAIKIDDAYSMAIDNLGTIDFTDKKYSDAEKKFKEALSCNSKNTTAMYHLAQIAMVKKDSGTALMYLNNALSLNPNSTAIYSLMGKAYQAQGNDAAAINAFKKSIAIRPEFTASYLDLSNIYERRGDNEFAIEQLKTVLSVNPDLNNAKLRLADISLANGDFDQSISYYSQLVGIQGFNDNALKGLANAYYAQAQSLCSKGALSTNHDLNKALDSINKAISANNQDLELNLAKLKLSEMTNQPEQTKVALNNIIKSPANDLGSLVVKGEAYLAVNDYQNAQNSFSSAINLSKSSEDDSYLTDILIYEKQYDLATKIIDKTLKADPKNQEALNNLDYIQKSKKCADNYYKSAQKFLSSRNYSTAMEYLNSSLAINPNNANAHMQLGNLYEDQKDYAEAVAQYQAYLGLEPNAGNSKSVEKRILRLGNKL